jgi:uncharacterized protein YndB with AHSA1/START domain
MPLPLEIDFPSDREIRVVRAFEAPRNLVFDCWTIPALIRRWYGLPDWTMKVCEMDARVGGRWRFVTRGPDGAEMGSGGEIRELVRPELLKTTERYDMDWTGGETLVTNVFTEERGRTLSTLTVLYSSKAARDGARATPMAEGMEIGYRRLDAVLAEQAA